MSRPGGFSTYWTARNRLLLEGAEPLAAGSLSELPPGVWADVEVIGVETVGGSCFSVRDGSGRTARAPLPETGAQPAVGDRGRFRLQLKPGAPQVLRLKSESGFALVRANGEVELFPRLGPALEAAGGGRFVAEFSVKERGGGLRRSLGQ